MDWVSSDALCASATASMLGVSTTISAASTCVITSAAGVSCASEGTGDSMGASSVSAEVFNGSSGAPLADTVLEAEFNRIAA
jgi:hypothetical protein